MIATATQDRNDDRQYAAQAAQSALQGSELGARIEQCSHPANRATRAGRRHGGYTATSHHDSACRYVIISSSVDEPHGLVDRH
jgi:hypothetical protein